MGKTIFILITALVLSLFCGCIEFDSSVEDKQAEQTDLILEEVNSQLGMPNITNFKQKRTMKMIYEQADREDLICYAYIVASYSGELKYIGRCVGYGVPFSAQYTNPERVIKYRTSHYYAGSSPSTMPQADPNGLYMPTASSATWLLMIDKDGESRPVYLEPEIVVSPFKLH